MHLPSPTPGWTLRVPASTSNLGPGFDLLGLALSLYVELRVVARSEAPGVRVVARTGTAGEWPEEAEADLVRRALAAVLTLRGAAPQPGLALAVHSDVPLQRGLGSSGAAVASGLLLGASLLEEPPTPAELLRLGIELEGHPDNVAASLHGGLTLCHPDAGPCGEPLVVPAELHANIAVAVAWPERRQATSDARRALPATVPFADAVENPRRLGLLLAGLRTGAPALLAAGSHDRLHERFRLRTIPGGSEALAAARAAGAWSAHVSGSGSALVALGPRAELEPIATAMRHAFEQAGQRAWSRVCAVHRDPVVPTLEDA